MSLVQFAHQAKMMMKFLIQQIFSGDNIFTLSDQDDVIDGYAGNDSFETGLGNDVIDGGSGTDTVKFSGNYSSYQITHDLTQDKFIIKGSNENKTVANVEQFNFNDVSYSSNELKEKINPTETYTPPSSANNSGATLYANEGFDINNFNFYSLVAGEQQLQYQYPGAPSFNTMANFNRFGTNLDGSLGVMSLKDSALYSDSGTYPLLISTFAGTGLPLNSFNNFYVNSGTINAYAEDSYSLTGMKMKSDWGIYDINISASSTFNAIRSVSKSDDEALIQQMLSGDDLFTLSDEDDVIDGYAGNDRFETGLGNDVIDGGSGTDTVKFLGNYADYSYSYSSQTNSSTFSKAGDTKIVSNVENFIFNDSTYSLSQINNLNIQSTTPSVTPPTFSNNGVIIDADYSLDLMNINFNRIYKASNDFANTYQTQSWTIV